MLLESSPVLNAIHLIHEHKIRLTVNFGGEPYLFARFLTISRYKSLMLSVF